MPRIGVASLVVAKVTQDTVDGVTYDTPVKFTKKLIRIGYQPTVNRVNLEADDQIVETVTGKGETRVTIDVTDLTPTEKALLLGSGTVQNGMRISNKDDQAPYFCVMFKSKKSSGGYRYVKLLKVQFQENNETYETKRQTPAFQNPTIEGVAIPRIYDGNDIVDADDDESTWDASLATNWFTSGDIPTVTP
ncbi:major tail protein [Petroclostridium sp. X23]|uniref:major tail protein n=1 Tax=Petroclostridium sp. X23 TaxID=3045146 RepID=UPI0024ADEEC5|nr:major tail protein [Petroclostridium sp. X23]WHH59167.1 hypothetical protein QKW49_25835 [Petroclostridium sp. X23]